MKCDELQYERLGDANKTYPASTLVIRKQFVDDAIAELKDENERLEKCCKEYDSRQRIDEQIKSNGAKQLRATKRALWLARAAMCRTYDSCAYFIEKPDSKRRFIEFFVLMQKAAATAAIKAEEYK